VDYSSKANSCNVEGAVFFPRYLLKFRPPFPKYPHTILKIWVAISHEI
jgi:hypothetical protein